MSRELAQYISEYVKEEINRGNEIDVNTILDAVDAYKGGAR